MKTDHFTQTIVLAISEYGNAHVIDACMAGKYGYVAASEPMTVTFTSLPEDVVVQGQLAALDEVEDRLRGELADKVAALNSRRNELRAITYSGSPA